MAEPWVACCRVKPGQDSLERPTSPSFEGDLRNARRERSARQRVKKGMTIIGSRLCLFVAGIDLVAGSAFAQAPGPAPTPTAPTDLAAPGQNLSEKLSRSNGVIHPKEVDPAIEKPAPDVRYSNVAPPPARDFGRHSRASTKVSALLAIGLRRAGLAIKLEVWR